MAYRVIVADDEPIMRKAMLSLINWAELGCELEYIAANGQEVIDRLELLKPDIVIADIKMPGKNGIDVARYIWENHLTVKVILLTAYADFSYAQAAIKYDVTDYVIKTGAFEGVVAAVEKAKAKLQQDAMGQKAENTDAVKENFYKSVFDGSLYEETELTAAAGSLELPFSAGYLVMLIHFRIDEDAEGEKRQRNHKSMLNFLHMVFGEQMLQGITVSKNMIALVLSQEAEAFAEDIRQKCMQIIDMMDHFMKVYVYIGISRRSVCVKELKGEYDRAENAVGQSFFDDRSNLVFYSAEKDGPKGYFKEIEKQQEELYFLLKKGAAEEALAAFHALTGLQKLANVSAYTILNTGMNIFSWCRKLLTNFDKNIYAVEYNGGNIANQINLCRHVSEYTDIMDTVIKTTSKLVGAAASRKNMLIYECEKYIEENYEKCISVADISRIIGASPSYLSRIFKETTGSTIINAINLKKVEKAKEYLKNTDLKVYEIADALGFENTTYFSHFFKKYTGMSPKDCK